MANAKEAYRELIESMHEGMDEIYKDLDGIVSKEELASDSASVLPGNYHVLRNTDATAILGEASFISSKTNEKELSFQRTAMREAKGYFLGIIDYFSKGIPEVALVEPENIILKTAKPLVRAHIDPGSENTSVSRKDITMTVNNKKIRSFNWD